MLGRVTLFSAISFSLLSVCLAASVAEAQSGKQWKCSAPGLVSSSYTGGSTAYIHLSGFATGGTYPVTKKGNVATGVTANGTKFTCKQ